MAIREVSIMLNSLTLAVYDEFVMWVSKWPVIVAICLCVLGVTIAILARRIARVIRKTNEIADNDRAYITTKIIAVILLFIAVLIIILM